MFESDYIEAVNKVPKIVPYSLYEVQVSPTVVSHYVSCDLVQVSRSQHVAHQLFFL